jgi:hypothetical protein
MSIFRRKNRLGETERRRLWDGLAEFLRLNFRPDDGAPVAGAAAAPTDAAFRASSLELRKFSLRRAAKTGGARDDAAAGFMANAMMPAAMSSAMMVEAEKECAEEAAECPEDVAEECAEVDAEAVVEEYAEVVEEADAEVAEAPAEVVADAIQLRKVTAKKRSLGDVVKQVGETWQQSLLRAIDERGYTDAEVYKRAGLDRKLFSKIRCNESYQPKKPTAVALALALQLSLDETKDMLARAGYALSPSSRFDLIVEYFIENDVYDVDTINIALYEYGQQLLGA